MNAAALQPVAIRHEAAEPASTLFKPATEKFSTLGVAAHPKELAKIIVDLTHQFKPLHNMMTGSPDSADPYIPEIEKLAEIIGTSLEYDTVREATALMLYHFSIYRYGILEDARVLADQGEQLDAALEGIEKAFGLPDAGSRPATPHLAGLL